MLDTFPNVPKTSNTYEEEDYLYAHVINVCYVQVKDKTKTSHGNIITLISGEELLTMEYWFQCYLNL